MNVLFNPTDYLKNYPKRSYEGFKGSFRVIQAGLANRPDLKARLEEINERIAYTAANTSSHLSDIGCSLNFVKQNLEALIKDVFEAHRIEKEEDI